MLLTPGSRLGPYEIVSPVGSGGMGEIYRARDTRLDRTVAIKVISPLLSGTPELRERFEREARAVSQLNHPHICTLHDIGHDQGTDYLVLEFLDGESLADRLQRGPLTVDQAIATAIQICGALERAHRAGIVHRDLKPGNVFLVRGTTASALPTAKLLDFGLAKASAASPSAAGAVNLTSPPTVTTPLTAQGTILGTFQYMAPEQLEGADADARTDIWAFGCVLYEMLTGRKAFTGRTHASLISSIMSSEPAGIVDSLPAAPPVLDQVIRTCLEKDPAERFQTIHDLLLQLRWIAGGSTGRTTTATAIPPRHRGRGWSTAATVVGVALVASAATWWLMRPVPPVPLPVVRAVLTLPPKLPLALFASSNVAFSPDGRQLAYVAALDEGATIYIHQLDQFGPGVALSGTTNAFMPFFSPDGTWIGFFSSGGLQKVPVGGGAATRICDLPAAFGAVWAADDTIVFSHAETGVLMRVPASGGTPVPVTSLASGEQAHRWPTLLPDGSLLYAVNRGTGWSEARIVVQPAEGGAPQTVIEAGTFPRYVQSGHIAFVRKGVLLAVPFDARTRRTMGAPRQVADAVAYNDVDGRAQFAVAPNGMLAYVTTTPPGTARSLVWVSRDGSTQPIPLEPRAYEHPRISPDGRFVAVAIRDSNPDVWVADLERRTLTRVTFEPGEDESPVWTPDGKHITYSSSRAGKPRSTYWKAADNSGVEEALFTSKLHSHLSGWTPDGRTLISEEMDTTFGLYTATVAEKTVKPFLQTGFTEVAGHLSPDGKWIAYSSNESGPSQVYAQAFPGPGGRVQISTDGGTEPRWAPNGRELFYRSGDRMMVVSIEPGATLKMGVPRVLFEGQYARIGWGEADYDVARDGRFLMLKGGEDALPTQVHLVVNLLDELRRVAPREK